jgi:hypothetical protein
MKDTAFVISIAVAIPFPYSPPYLYYTLKINILQVCVTMFYYYEVMRRPRAKVGDFNTPQGIG